MKRTYKDNKIIMTKLEKLALTHAQTCSYDYEFSFDAMEDGFIVGFKTARDMMVEAILEELGNKEALKAIGCNPMMGEENDS